MTTIPRLPFDDEPETGERGGQAEGDGGSAHSGVHALRLVVLMR